MHEQVACAASLPLKIGGLPAERDPGGERGDSSQCATSIHSSSTQTQDGICSCSRHATRLRGTGEGMPLAAESP
jgi:hypothetical protein